jgi:thiol-disulfide isomerase/thioredoxin
VYRRVVLLLATLVITALSHASPAPLALPEALPMRQDAPALLLKSAAGQEIRLGDYRGRWVLVHFWASWCSACIEELPDLERLQQALPQLQVLAVNLGDRPATVEDWRRRLALQLPLLRETGGRAMRSWEVQGLPLSVLVAPDGKMVSRITGSRDWDSPVLREWLRAWLQSSDKSAGPR